MKLQGIYYNDLRRSLSLLTSYPIYINYWRLRIQKTSPCFFIWGTKKSIR